MKHYGDICKINGAEIEPVWCITGGSPYYIMQECEGRLECNKQSYGNVENYTTKFIQLGYSSVD